MRPMKRFPSITVIHKHAVLEAINAVIGCVAIMDTINTASNDMDFQATMGWAGFHRF